MSITSLHNDNSEFICPILHDIMEKPTKANPCGHIFERSAIEHWLTSNPTCPLDRRIIVDLTPDEDLEKKIKEHLEKQTAPQPEAKEEDIETQTAQQSEKWMAIQRLVKHFRGLDQQVEMPIQQADQIIVEKVWVLKRFDREEYIRFTGTPIDRIYRKYSREENTQLKGQVFLPSSGGGHILGVVAGVYGNRVANDPCEYFVKSILNEDAVSQVE